jgi:hypothetical protein
LIWSQQHCKMLPSARPVVVKIFLKCVLKTHCCNLSAFLH